MQRNFSKDMQCLIREAVAVLRRDLPRAVGTLAVNHFCNNFRRGLFVCIASDAPYAQVHNEGGDIKVFGCGKAVLPARQFIGDSTIFKRKYQF